MTNLQYDGGDTNMNKIIRKINKNGLELSYIIQFKNIKGIYLRIKEGVPVVTSRYGASLDDLDDFVYENYETLKKGLDNWESLDYKGDEKIIRYFGKLYPLVVNKGVDNVYFDDALYVFSNCDNQVVKLIDEFYQHETSFLIQKFYEENYNLFSKYKLIPKSIGYKKMKGKWGYCNPSSKEIVLNISLSKLNEIFCYYVLCHELCHIRYPNHGKEFHSVLEVLYPNHQKIKLLAKDKRL